MLEGIAAALPAAAPRRPVLSQLAQQHRDAGLRDAQLRPLPAQRAWAAGIMKSSTTVSMPRFQYASPAEPNLRQSSVFDDLH